MEGYVKIYRKLLNSSIFDNEKALKIWIWCLLKATHKDMEQLVGLQVVNLKNGQFVFGRKKASEELKMSESTIYKYMDLLTNMKLISKKSNNKFSVITIEKWEEYQLTDFENNNKVTTKEQQSNTNKNIKNIKNNISASDDAQNNTLHEHFEKIWEAYPVKKGKQKAETYFFQWIKGRKINNRLLKLTDVDMWYAVDSFLREIKQKGTDLKYVPHGDTFFNSKIYDYYELWKEKNE